ncbi:unnamed protein product [Bathycoccus prasinos]|jgi:hypothetical protein
MLSASAVDALWRACLFKLSKLLALDIRLDDASTSSSPPEEDVTTIESPPSDDSDDDENEDENDALSVYLRYLSILRALNLCEHSCVHPQKHRLIDRLMSCVYFRAAKVRLKGEEENLFDTETMEERLRHRNETKENGNMVVPTRFWRERRGFLRKEVASVMEKVNADVTAKRTREMDFDAPDDDGRQSDEKNGLDEEEALIIESTNAEETNSKEEEDEEMREVVVAEGVGVVAEELNEEEVKEKRESSLAKYADEKHRLAVVNVQRHARGCLARKKMRRKVEDELERLGMLVLNNDDATTTTKKKMKMNVCNNVDSRSRSTFACAGSEEEDKDDDISEDNIETKIELLRGKRLQEFEQNQPHVYERTKKALLEEHGSKIETFVREYRETHQGALPELKDINIFDDDDERNKKEKDDDDAADVTENKTASDENTNNGEDDRKCGFEALRKILEESERAFPSATTTSSISNDDDANTQEINDNRRERRNTSFSEQAEKRAIEREVLKEVSIEIKENVKLALERMRQEDDVNDATLTTKTTRKEEDGNSKSATEAAMKNKSSATKKAKKKKQTNGKTKKKSTKCPKSCASALEQEKALYDSIDAYPMAKYLLQHNVKIDCFCSSEREKKYDGDDTVVNNNTFIASGADEFVYCEEEAPDRSVDDQKRAIESIKSNVLIPLGASTSSVWLESYAHNAEKPKHLLFIGPRGCGQKHFAKNVLARETGSVFFDCSIENVMRRRSKEANATTTEHDGDDTKDTEQDDESAFCADLLKRTFQLAKKWAPSVVYVGNIENAFATGKKKKTKTKKGNEEEGEEDEDRNVSEENTVGNGGIGTDGTQVRADASVSSNAKTSYTQQTQKVDPKSFKAGLTAALKSLEKENNSSRRVCVVASISDASRLTKKDEKSVLGKIFHPKDTFAAPFMRPSRAARYDLLKTFYREVVDEYYTDECNNDTSCLSSSKKSTKSKSRMFSKVVADGARDEGAVSELSHSAETCNRKVLKLCVREGFRKAVEYISTKSIVQPRAFTDSQRALVWRFASESLRNLRETNQKRIDEEQDDFYDENENAEAEFFFADENESTLRLFAKRVCCRLR